MKIEVNIPDEHIEQALSGAFDSGGIAYWARIIGGHYRSSSIAYNVLHLEGWVQLAADHFDDKGMLTPTRLDRESIARGLALMAEQYEHSFMLLSEGSADAHTGDVLVQLSVFGKLVFG